MCPTRRPSRSAGEWMRVSPARTVRTRPQSQYGIDAATSGGVLGFGVQELRITSNCALVSPCSSRYQEVGTSLAFMSRRRASAWTSSISKPCAMASCASVTFGAADWSSFEKSSPGTKAHGGVRVSIPTRRTLGSSAPSAGSRLANAARRTLARLRLSVAPWPRIPCGLIVFSSATYHDQRRRLARPPPGPAPAPARRPRPDAPRSPARSRG